TPPPNGNAEEPAGPLTCEGCGFQLKADRMRDCPQCGRRFRTAPLTDPAPAAVPPAPAPALSVPPLPASPAPAEPIPPARAVAAAPDPAGETAEAAREAKTRRLFWGAIVAAWFGAAAGAALGASLQAGEAFLPLLVMAGVGAVAGLPFGIVFGLLQQVRDW